MMNRINIDYYQKRNINYLFPSVRVRVLLSAILLLLSVTLDLTKDKVTDKPS